jgi:hypothetical protein
MPGNTTGVFALPVGFGPFSKVETRLSKIDVWRLQTMCQ